MKLWSRGLGRRELGMDFRHYVVRKSDDGGIDIFGITNGPVSWEFRIHVAPEDVPGLVNVGLTRPMVKFLVRHWLTALASTWRRRRYRPADGMEDRVKRAYDQVVGGARARPAPVSGGGPPAGGGAGREAPDGGGVAAREGTA